MHKDHVELLIKRAKNFLEIAKDRLNKEDWDLTCFNIEQAVQLYLKATILEISGDLPRIHSIRHLVSIFIGLTKQEVKWDNDKYYDIKIGKLKNYRNYTWDE